MGSWTQIRALQPSLPEWGSGGGFLGALCVPAARRDTQGSVRPWPSVQHCRGLCPCRAFSACLWFQMNISDQGWKASGPPSSCVWGEGAGLGLACHRTSSSSVATWGGQQPLETGALWPTTSPSHPAAEASFSLARPLTAMHVPVCLSVRHSWASLADAGICLWSLAQSHNLL